MCGIDDDQAERLLQRRGTIKKGLEHREAYVVKRKLEEAGLNVKLQRLKPVYVKPTEKPKSVPLASISVDSLSLEPLEEEKGTFLFPSNSSFLSRKPTASVSTLESHSLADMSFSSRVRHSTVCPKCGAKQSSSYECSACGVYISKFLKIHEAPPARGRAFRLNTGNNTVVDHPPVIRNLFFTASIALFIALTWWVLF